MRASFITCPPRQLNHFTRTVLSAHCCCCTGDFSCTLLVAVVISAALVILATHCSLWWSLVLYVATLGHSHLLWLFTLPVGELQKQKL